MSGSTNPPIETVGSADFTRWYESTKDFFERPHPNDFTIEELQAPGSFLRHMAARQEGIPEIHTADYHDDDEHQRFMEAGLLFNRVMTPASWTVEGISYRFGPTNFLNQLRFGYKTRLDEAGLTASHPNYGIVGFCFAEFGEGAMDPWEWGVFFSPEVDTSDDELVGMLGRYACLPETLTDHIYRQMDSAILLGGASDVQA